MDSRVFTLIGDSNIRGNVNQVNRRACPALGAAQVLYCQRLDLLDEVLRQVQPRSDAVILSCLSNFLSSSEDTSELVGRRVEPVLDELRSCIQIYSSARPEVYFLLAPPMYRQVLLTSCLFIFSRISDYLVFQIVTNLNLLINYSP